MIIQVVKWYIDFLFVIEFCVRGGDLDDMYCFRSFCLSSFGKCWGQKFGQEERFYDVYVELDFVVLSCFFWGIFVIDRLDISIVEENMEFVFLSFEFVYSFLNCR